MWLYNPYFEELIKNGELEEYQIRAIPDWSRGRRSGMEPDIPSYEKSDAIKTEEIIP